MTLLEQRAWYCLMFVALIMRSQANDDVVTILLAVAVLNLLFIMFFPPKQPPR